MTAPSDDKFTLAGGDAKFGSRAKNIFAGLESLEARHAAVESSEAARRESYALMKPDPTDDFFSGSSDPSDSGNFQVPSRPPPKRVHSSPRPGYESSPSKWKRYDLSDVSISQLTEQSNKNAAKDFLSRFQVPAGGAVRVTDSVTDTDRDMRHVFRKPDKKQASEDNAELPASGGHRGIEDAEDDDETEYQTRTQILSFAEDDPLDDGRQTLSGKAEFRRRRVKRSAERQVRNETTCSDDDDEERTSHTTRTGPEAHDYEEVTPSLSDNIRTASDDNESDSDNFSDLAQLGSDSEQEEEPSDVEKYVPEDVDLDSID